MIMTLILLRHYLRVLDKSLEIKGSNLSHYKL